MSQDVPQPIDLFRRQLALLYFLKFSLIALTVWAFVFGTVVLALRGALHTDRLDLLWGLFSLPLALIPAAYLTWKRMPTPVAVRAVLDGHGRLGGLLMAGAEQPIGEWERRLPEVRQPRLSWDGRRSWGGFSVGLVFVAFAFLIPQSTLANFGGPTLDVDKEAEQLGKQLDILEKEKILEKQRAGDLKASLEQVRREAKGTDPIKTLESLDHLKDTANKAAQDAAEAASRKMEDVGRIETFAETLDKHAPKMDKAQLTEAMQELAKWTKKVMDEKELMELGIDKETLDAIKESTLKPEQIKKLLDSLKDAKADTKAKIGRLVKAKLLKPEDLDKCDKAGKCDCEGLIAFLKENGVKGDTIDALSEEGGKGGVDRGPGAAKLDFGDESTDAGTKFKEEELPASEQQSLKDSTLSGVSTGTPQIGKEKPTAGSAGALSKAKSGGGSAATQTVLPRHRGAVERYFDRPATMPKK